MKHICGIIVGLIVMFLALNLILVGKTTLIPSILCLVVATVSFLFADVAWGKFMIANL